MSLGSFRDLKKIRDQSSNIRDKKTCFGSDDQPILLSDLEEDYDDRITPKTPNHEEIISTPIAGNYSNWHEFYNGPQGFFPGPVTLMCWPQVWPMSAQPQPPQNEQPTMKCGGKENLKASLNSQKASMANSTYQPVDIEIKNFDERIEPREIPDKIKTIFNIFKIEVADVSLGFDLDGQLKAKATLPSMHEAEKAVSHLAKFELGSKELNIKICKKPAANTRHTLRDLGNIVEKSSKSTQEITFSGYGDQVIVISDSEEDAPVGKHGMRTLQGPFPATCRGMTFCDDSEDEMYDDLHIPSFSYTREPRQE